MVTVVVGLYLCVAKPSERSTRTQNYGAIIFGLYTRFKLKGLLLFFGCVSGTLCKSLCAYLANRNQTSRDAAKTRWDAGFTNGLTCAASYV